jgi:hypothetical protein
MPLAPERHVERLQDPVKEYVRHHTPTPPNSDRQNTQVVAAPRG